MLLNANPEVVDRLITAFNPQSLNQLTQMRTALAGAIRASMQNVALYQIPLDAPLQPGADLSTIVHPYNLAATLLHVCAATGLISQPAVPVPEDVYVYGIEWVAVSTCVAPPLLRPIIQPAPQPAVVAPAPSVAALDQLLGVEQAAPAPAQATFAPPAATTPAPAPPEPVPVVLQQPGTINVPEDLQPDTRSAQGVHPGVIAAALPNPDVTKARNTEAGRSAKSPFDRQYRPRERIGRMPSWWPGLTQYLQNLFSQDPVQLVAVENSPSPVMEYTLAVDLAQRLLNSAPDHLSAGELKAWLADVQARIATSQAAPVAWDICNTLSEQRAEALSGKKQKASGGES